MKRAVQEGRLVDSLVTKAEAARLSGIIRGGLPRGLLGYPEEGNNEDVTVWLLVGVCSKVRFGDDDGGVEV